MALTTHELWTDGRQMEISIQKVDATTIRLTWKLPNPITAYNGAVVLLSESKFSSLQFPKDGTRYAPSTNWLAPLDVIEGAHVVASFYGFFGDNITTTSVDITGVDPSKMYYASIHAASNILQYYSIGCQSYPLEGSRIENGAESFAGSIPTAVTPPPNPKSGDIYYDPNQNLVFVWNDAAQAWIKSQQGNIPVGQRPPLLKSQIFFNTTDSQLKYFTGTSWVTCSPLNTRIKFGATWIPFNSATQQASIPVNPVAGDFVYITIPAAVSAPPTYQLKMFTIGSWFDITPGLIQVDLGGTWTEVVLGSSVSGGGDPQTPQVGDFFYNTSKHDLLVWSGSDWVKADTAGDGSPTTDKIGIGTDGSSDERYRLIKILKHQLGWPQVCNELNEEHFNIAIDNALDTFRQRADNAYAQRFISFSLLRGQNTYYLNDPRVGTDKVVNVIKIYRVNMLGINSLSAENGLYAQAFFNQLYQGSTVDTLSIHLMHQMSELYEKIFAGNLMFVWDEPTRQLQILRRLSLTEERVVIEVMVERTEQELLLDRWCKQWLQSWAQSELWEMLGEIRSKYSTLPGPNGGVTLNGQDLLSRSTAQQTELFRQLNEYEVGNGFVIAAPGMLLG